MGYNVDYRSLEVDKEYLLARSISILTDIPTDDIIEEKNKTLVEDRLAEVEKKFPNKKEIVIFHDNPNELTNSQIGQDLLISQQEGRKVHSLLVDYLDLMKSERTYRERHHEVGDNAIGLRSLADEFDIAAFSPSQFQRDTFKDKKKSKARGREGIQGAFSKVYTCDILIDLNAELVEETDYESNNKMIEFVKAYVDKNRFGRTGALFTLRPDKETGRFFDPTVLASHV
jgi:replicative DNA helicase